VSQVAFEVRRGAYYDSVVLMQLQRGLAELPAVEDAGVVMATPANLELLQQNALLPAQAQAGPDDLLIVVRAGTPAEAQAALSQVDALLARRRGSSDQAYRPRSLEAAVKQLPEAGWVLISVPGRYAAAVARQALDLRRHVFLYSDNVSLEDEAALKQAAQAAGLLVMGPDCGTAIINGVGLGFANRVRRGDIGLVAAAGTGLQAVSVDIHRLGGGISQAIGTGGRDLKSEIGGVTTLQGLDLLAGDPETRVIVLVSKPPDGSVTQRILTRALRCRKPVVVHFMGIAPPGSRVGNLHFASSLAQAAELAVGLAGAGRGAEVHRPAGGSVAAVGGRGMTAGGSVAAVSSGSKPSGAGAARANAGGSRRFLRGLFAGGTLAGEALRGLQALLGPVQSNLDGTRPRELGPGHLLLDLGADEFTVGRLHPMLDNDLRLRRFRQEAADPAVALILMDIVLGEGAHPDPAAEWAPAIAEAVRQHAVEVVLLLVGTEDDPQGFQQQWQRLAEAGAAVYEQTEAALEHVMRSLGPELPAEGAPVSISPGVAAINLGLESFYESLLAQGAQAVQVEWRPPAGGDERMMALLERMKAKA
jgi:FdrA protein